MLETLLAGGKKNLLDTPGTGLHSEFLNSFRSSDALKGLLHPLGGPWRELIANVRGKGGRLGLPEGMLLLNQLFKFDKSLEVPDNLAVLREEVVAERFSPRTTGPRSFTTSGKSFIAPRIGPLSVRSSPESSPICCSTTPEPWRGLWTCSPCSAAPTPPRSRPGA